MLDTKLAWLAGIIDGEGCITLFSRTYVTKKGENRIIPSANVTITNSNFAMIREASEILKNLDIKYVISDPKNKGRKAIRRMSIRNHTSILSLLGLLRPFLIAKKDQADCMIRFVRKAMKKDFDIAERIDIQIQLRLLNHQSSNFPVETKRHLPSVSVGMKI